MNLLPIARRELRVAARRPATYRARMLMALFALAITTGMLLFSPQAYAQTGRPLFFGLLWAGFAFCLSEGIRQTSDALSEEKREGTLGLLFLTDLRGYDVVIGKLAAAGLNSFYGLMGALPALAIPFVLGGVSGAEFVRGALVLAGTLWLSLVLGLFVSSLSHDSQRAMNRAFCLLFGIAAYPVVLNACKAIGGDARLLDWLSCASPGAALALVSENYYRPRASLFVEAIAGTQIVAWCALVWTSWLTPRVWQQRNATVVDTPRLRAREVSPKKLAQLAEVRREQLDRNPVFWLTARRHGPQTGVWLAWLIVAGCFILVLYFFPSHAVSVGLLTLVLGILQLLLKLRVGSEAARFFSEARRNGSLELMLSTPLKTNEIISGQLLGLRHLFFWPALVLLGLWILLSLLSTKWVMNVGAPTPVRFAFAGGPVQMIGQILVFIWDLRALAAVGIWLGLRAKNHNRAAFTTILYVLVLPWLAGIFLMPVIYLFLGLAQRGGAGLDPMAAFLIALIQPLLWLAKDSIFICWASNRLRQSLRQTAAGIPEIPAPSLLIAPPVISPPGNIPPVLRG